MNVEAAAVGALPFALNVPLLMAARRSIKIEIASLRVSFRLPTPAHFARLTRRTPTKRASQGHPHESHRWSHFLNRLRSRLLRAAFMKLLEFYRSKGSCSRAAMY